MMRKILSVLLVVALMLSMSGCLVDRLSALFGGSAEKNETASGQMNSAVTMDPDFKFEYGYGTEDSEGNIHIIIPGLEDSAVDKPQYDVSGGAVEDTPSNEGTAGSPTEGESNVIGRPEVVYPPVTDPSNCNHSYSQVSLTDSTCTKEGTKVSRCTKCNTTRTEKIAKKEHSWLAATCQSPATCNDCGATTGSKASHFCSYPSNDCTVADYCDGCGTTMRAAKSSHSFSSGRCTDCAATDPNYIDTSKIKIKYNMTFFPVSISYGTITGCTHEIDGKDLILKIQMKRNNAGGSQSLKAYYRISDPNLNTVAIDSYSTSSMSAGSSTTVTVRISGILTKTGSYEVYLTNYQPQW